ncbi:hypothetical protein [Candidatus Tisiphia endosymbiont of Parasteatoda lunata]
MRHSCRNIKLCTCSAEWLTRPNLKNQQSNWQLETIQKHGQS